MELLLPLFKKIKDLGDETAALLKKVPLNQKARNKSEISPENEELIMRSLVITRQIGELSQCISGILKIDYSTNDADKEYRIWRGFLLGVLSDVLYQTQQICQLLNFDFYESIEIGKERNQDKRAEFSHKNPDLIWY